MALVELSVVEQRYRAILDAVAGVPVTEVAARYGVSRQSVHAWIRRFEQGGLSGLLDRSRQETMHQLPQIPHWGREGQFSWLPRTGGGRRH